MGCRILMWVYISMIFLWPVSGAICLVLSSGKIPKDLELVLGWMVMLYSTPFVFCYSELGLHEDEELVNGFMLDAHVVFRPTCFPPQPIMLSTIYLRLPQAHMDVIFKQCSILNSSLIITIMFKFLLIVSTN